MTIASTPMPPYFAVIFTSQRTAGDNGYGKMAEAMETLAATQPGFLGIESARDGLGITVSYWEGLEAIAAWKANATHLVAQQRGRGTWYEEFKVRICRVERDYAFARE
ncbi:MAG: antibiotic biosynthesis monooxygenase [Terracidiphilus sp.]